MTPTIDWSTIVAGASMTVVSHPFSYVKTLIQLGYEPLEPVLKKDLFFRKKLMYPGVFAYINVIKDRDGFIGLFRGVAPRVLANATMSITYGQMKNNLEIEEVDPAVEEKPRDLPLISYSLAKESVARCTAVVVSHPFHVVAVRCMASFVGDNQLFASPWACIKQTYEEDGILGFFAGIVPRMVMEVLCMWLTELSAHAINTYIISHKSQLRDLRSYTTMATSSVFGGQVYPLSVTSTMMICNGTSLPVASSPYTLVYTNWWHCFSDLRSKGYVKRGASLLFRQPVMPRSGFQCPATHVVTTPSLSPPAATITELADIPVVPAAE